MNHDALRAEARTRIVAGELPSAVLRSMLEPPSAAKKSDLARVLADAFDDRVLWHLVLHWQRSTATDVHDTAFNVQVITCLHDAGISIPWTPEYCRSERNRIQPMLDAERAAELQATIDAVSFEQLAEKISALPGRVRCLQALWDGDTSGWFICLSALVSQGDALKEVHLGVVKFGTDFRLFNQKVPPWPEARHAADVGAALAARFECVFYFPSPDSPDDSCPPWSP